MGVYIDQILKATEVDKDGKHKNAWVPFKGDAEVFMSYCSPKRMKQLRDDCRVKKWEGGKLVRAVDEEKLNDKLKDEIVHDWRGFVNSDESVFPFSRDNLVLLMDHYTEFATFVNDACLDIENFVREQQEAVEKNS